MERSRVQLMFLTARAEETWRGSRRGSGGEGRGAGAAAAAVPPDPTMMGLYYPAMLPVSWPPPPPPPELICTVDSVAQETRLACAVQQMEKKRMKYIYCIYFPLLPLAVTVPLTCLGPGEVSDSSIQDSGTLFVTCSGCAVNCKSGNA